MIKKISWNLIKLITNKRTNSSEDPVLIIEGKLMNNPQVIANPLTITSLTLSQNQSLK